MIVCKHTAAARVGRCGQHSARGGGGRGAPRAATPKRRRRRRRRARARRRGRRRRPASCCRRPPADRLDGTAFERSQPVALPACSDALTRSNPSPSVAAPQGPPTATRPIGGLAPHGHIFTTAAAAGDPPAPRFRPPRSFASPAPLAARRGPRRRARLPGRRLTSAREARAAPAARAAERSGGARRQAERRAAPARRAPERWAAHTGRRARG
jgi:hypothetical protein